MLGQVLKVVVQSQTLITGLSSNLFVILTVVACRQYVKTGYLIMTSMAVQEALYALTVLLPRTLSMGKREWILSERLCKVSTNLAFLLSTSTLLHLCAITWEGYLAITNPFSYKSKVTWKKKVLLYFD